MIFDALSRLAYINVGSADLFYFELDALFTYNTTLVKIYLSLISRILAGCEDDKYETRFYYQVQVNGDLSNNRALLHFVSSCFY